MKMTIDQKIARYLKKLFGEDVSYTDSRPRDGDGRFVALVENYDGTRTAYLTPFKRPLRAVH